MPRIDCPLSSCDYATDDVDISLAVILLTIHNNEHTNSNSTPTKQHAPKLARPAICKGASEETWNTFIARWEMFKNCTNLSQAEVCQQLFHCCDENLGDDILKCHSSAIQDTEQNLLSIIKKIAVIPTAISVKRAELLSIRQDHGENVRSFFARVSGKAATCNYTMNCSIASCNNNVNFTNIIIKDVLISGLSDDDIKKEVLGCSNLDRCSVQETVSFIESKEMARDALSKPSLAAAISYKKATPTIDQSKNEVKTNCKICKTQIAKFVWNKRRHRMIECTLCLTCWHKSNPRRTKPDKQNSSPAESSSIMIGVVENVRNISSDFDDDLPNTHKSISNAAVDSNTSLEHYIFDSEQGWKEAESSKHPMITLTLSTDQSDYNHINHSCPTISPCTISAITDTGAQSCLWGLQNFYKAGFKSSDLIPVKRVLITASKEKIRVEGAIFIRLSGMDKSGIRHIAPVMVYITPHTERFYLSRHALIQLKIISNNFPQIGGAAENASLDQPEHSSCECLKRILPPGKPTELPFPCIPENNEKMKEWLLKRYASSTFNRCAHQVLPGMTGPPITLHIDPTATPKAVHNPTQIPLHWQEIVEQQLKNDVAMGVIEEVPIGEPSIWCHRMVLVKKPDGTPRRTVDLSELNKHCMRETHHVKPPFAQAKSIPPNTWKSVTDAWNGYHSVPLRKEDRHLTTFITPIGRFRYCVAPQGFLASGDGYSRRFDEIISNVQNKTKCVDDTAMWDQELESHWWRMINFLELLGNNGIILNSDKFQFAQRTINFAGFQISDTQICPLGKYLNAIRDFPTPNKIKDIRSWFGLVNQVAHYNQLTSLMAPFKPLLSSKSKFKWTDEMNDIFNKSKSAIINAIKEGVEIFDLNKRTCLRPDWSKTGIGFFLSQKHCKCESLSPGCCNFGWKITLAGSRFLKPMETRYAPIEGEALAIAWSLEQTKYFTQGCDNLLIITDHKPLVKLLGNKTLDEITNPRLFRLKQRTLLWRFSISHMPGSSNYFSDATSRHPTTSTDDDPISNINATEILAPLRLNDPDHIDIDNMIASNSQSTLEKIRAVTWDVVKQETQKDKNLSELLDLISNGFPSSKAALTPSLQEFWEHRDELYATDHVILKKHRIIIPSSLREEILNCLHAAHQGITSMNERAKSSVYWPGITRDIQATRENCRSCNQNAPSQARLPPIEPMIPSSPFESIVCDYFTYKGNHYLVVADRLSGWTEQCQIKSNTNGSGSSGLISTLRKLFTTFGVPTEISTDGGPEFVAKETSAFFKQWGIRHRISSAYLPSSNGRAELAVKSTKRLLMDNIGVNGILNNDNIMRALLAQRNTPDPGCKLSPAQILFGRPLKDSLPQLRKDISTFDNTQVCPQWREAWELKEQALKTRYIKTLENLSEHTKSLTPLSIGDHVFIQNQDGRFATKWDRSGKIVDKNKFNQYMVKVDGTGRLTLRNRQFLRRYRPHNLQHNKNDHTQQGQIIPQDLEKNKQFTEIPPSSSISTPPTPVNDTENLPTPPAIESDHSRISPPPSRDPILTPPDTSFPKNHERTTKTTTSPILGDLAEIDWHVNFMIQYLEHTSVRTPIRH